MTAVVALLAGLVGLLLASSVALVWQRAQVKRVLRRTVADHGGVPLPVAAPTLDHIDRLDRVITRLEEGDAVAMADLRRLEAAASSMTQGAVVCATDGEVVFRNAFADTFIQARHGDALVAAAVTELLDAARHGAAAEKEIELFGPPRRTLLVSALPIADGAIALIDEITEHVRLDAMRRDFIANISHELRTPVGALSLLAETLADEQDPGLRNQLTHRLTVESARIARTIDELIELSRIEHNEDGQANPVVMQAVVGEAVDRVHPASDQKSLDLGVVVPDAPITVIGDRRQLTSALFNLLDNAVKYTDPGGSIGVRLRVGAETVELAVRDTGIGIPAKDLDRIFERFYRVDRARAGGTGGVGLGLAIVRHVVTNHLGQLHVESREGEGTTFTISLPLGPVESSVETPDHSEVT
ncbi:MAG: ATP-binding protein [Acidimicrobiales bacterium]